jgi:hypothetical protein
MKKLPICRQGRQIYKLLTLCLIISLLIIPNVSFALESDTIMSPDTNVITDEEKFEEMDIKEIQESIYLTAVIEKIKDSQVKNDHNNFVAISTQQDITVRQYLISLMMFQIIHLI